MEQKTSVVKKAFNPPDPKTKVPSTTSLSVEFENGDKGYFKLLKGVEDPFVVGVKVTYEIEKVEGRNYSVVTLPTATPKPQESPKANIPVKPKSTNDRLVEMKYETRVPLAKIIMDAIIAGKIETSQEEFRSWFSAITAEIDASLDELREW